MKLGSWIKSRIILKLSLCELTSLSERTNNLLAHNLQIYTNRKRFDSDSSPLSTCKNLN